MGRDLFIMTKINSLNLAKYIVRLTSIKDITRISLIMYFLYATYKQYYNKDICTEIPKVGYTRPVFIKTEKKLLGLGENRLDQLSYKQYKNLISNDELNKVLLHIIKYVEDKTTTQLLNLVNEKFSRYSSLVMNNNFNKKITAPFSNSYEVLSEVYDLFLYY